MLSPSEVPIDLPPPPTWRSRFFGSLRRFFLTGIVVTAPIVITLWAAYWVVTLFDAWVKPLVPTVFYPDRYLPFSVPGIGLLFAFVFITSIGALAANLVGRTIISYWDNILNRTPVVRSVYKGTKQIFETLFSSQGGASFRSVGLIEWPRKGIYSIVFVSREIDGGQVGLEAGRKMYAVYISTTPNPTSGYVYFVDVADVRILDLPVEDALKLVISMGLVFPETGKPVNVIGGNIDQDIARKLIEAPVRKPKRRRKKPAAKVKAEEEAALTPPK
jgi:uncharacterized membrane protein